MRIKNAGIAIFILLLAGGSMGASVPMEIGLVKIDTINGTIEIPAQINMKEGLIEYLLAGEGGKLHESLLRTRAQAHSLQVALLLLGLKESPESISIQGDPGIPTGDGVTLWVQWDEKGKTNTDRIERWVKNQDTKKKMEPIPWIFTGSLIMDGRFLAQAEKSMIAIYRDPVAIINNPLPEGANDEIWFADPVQTLPEGSDCTVIIKIEKGKE